MGKFSIFEFFSPWINKIFVVVGLATLCTSCVFVTSKTDLGVEKKDRTSFAYMLPKAFVPIELLELEGEFIIRAGAAKYVGDPAHYYYGTYKPSAFSSDELNVTVGANGLLDEVNMDADDRTGAVLVNLAKSAAAIKTARFTLKESAVQSATIIAVVEIDPGDRESMVSASDVFTTAARHRIKVGIRQNCGKSGEEKAELCRTYHNLRRSRFEVGLTSSIPNLPEQVEMPDCSIGVCFRLPVPHRISAGFRLGGRSVASSVIVPLPNGGPIVATNFDRTGFVKKVIHADFTNGMLTKLTVKKPSEAEQIALLPVSIISAFFAQIGTTFRSRTEANAAEIAYINKLEELSEKRAKAKKESSLTTPGLLTVTTGKGRTLASAAVQPVELPKIDESEEEQPAEGAENPAENTTPNCNVTPLPAECLSQ